MVGMGARIGVALALLVCAAVVATSRAATEGKLPDLVEVTVSRPPAVVRPGSSFRIVDTVKNRGAAVAKATTTIYYIEGGSSGALIHTFVASRRVSALKAGATSAGSGLVRISRSIPGGVFSIRVCADEKHVARESNESNNCRVSANFRVKRGA